MEELLIKAARAGIRFEVVGDELKVTAPRGAMTPELQQEIKANKQSILQLLRRDQRHEEDVLPELVVDAASRGELFPLTDLQHAYWLGRDSSLEMGGVATHLYVELECQDLQVDRLNAALCRMIDRHDMLRAVLDGNGSQKILSVVPAYRIFINDQSLASAVEADAGIRSMREVLSHQVLQVDQWPLFDVRVTLLPDRLARLHVSLDLLILDAWSIFLFFKEWHQFYLDLDRQVIPFAISFRDYVLAEQVLKKSKSYLRSYEYWMKKVEGLPAAPDLPFCADSGVRRKPRFSRREARIASVRWVKLKEFARNHGLTPSCLLLAAYSEVLARWSSNPHFTINVTISNRLPLHADVQRLIGDFTTPMLQEIDRRDASKSFLEFALALQKQFACDMEHREVSGVAVMREWAKRRGIGLQAAMPVVFSSGLIWSGDEEPGDLEQFGKKVFSVSQTSQVWLDHHVMELNGDLVFIWDAVDGVFEPGVLDAMFAAYCRLVGVLHDSVDIWQQRDVVPLPELMLQQRVAVNATRSEWQVRALHADFVWQALRNPDRVAILTMDREISYATLLRYASGIADWLLASGLRPAERVAVVMHKGWEQVAAVLGVLLAGGAYMPVDANLPVKRQQDLLEIGTVRHVLMQPQSLKGGVAQTGVEVLEVNEGVCSDFSDHHQRSLEATDNIAYVIFTSGTTGVPKGVMIDHRAGMNTIEHINRLFGVGADDRVLGVSSLSFDLSVYDIFGLLGVGGALVIPDYRKGHDPVHWHELIVRHAVTVWNSAPQLMSMLLDSYTEIGSESFPIRTVLLSGDFIPLDIPARVRQHHAAAAVISLGGATEASIWSIYYPVETVSSAWASIPYGKPLPNQMIWVYDHAFRPCPDYVKGRIFIGGDGLAQGYWQDTEKTAARFLLHPVSGARLYDTGDLGRYADDGNVIILGRDDGQVKIRGHRIELGEVEAILRQHAVIQQCVVVANAASSARRYLIAYVTLQPGAAGLVVADGRLDSQSLRDFVAERLPEYMVPRVFVLLARLPVSANGKIDYRALPEVGDEHEEGRQGLVGARNAVEQLMLDIWSRLIPGNQTGVTDNFFELGGDSVLATHLVRELNAALPDFRLEMHELFENLTIESLALLYHKRIDGSAGDVVMAGAAPSVDQAAMLRDIEEGVRVVSVLDVAAVQSVSPGVPKAVFLTGASGWVGRYVLAELLMMTSACVYCLVRQGDVASAKQMLLECLRSTGVEYDSAWSARIVPVSGDLVEDRLGLSDGDWQILTGQVERIYHMGASVNVLADYATHSRTNVQSMMPLLRLATEVRLKPVFLISPMTVCRRRRATGVEVLFREQESSDHEGLLTGYAQSKWAAEQLLLAARDAGLPVKIYRTSHALPAVRTGAMQPGDTYCSILRVAHQVDVVPDWEDSAFHGVPVDRLAQLLVENSFLDDNHHGLVHLENHTPLSFPALLAVLRQGEVVPRVSLVEWQKRCIEAAEELAGEYASLARVLFANRQAGAAVHAMFAAHAVDTGYMDRLGYTDRMRALADAEYWRQFSRQPDWSLACRSY